MKQFNIVVSIMLQVSWGYANVHCNLFTIFSVDSNEKNLIIESIEIKQFK